jgi:hypothetical protein
MTFTDIYTLVEEKCDGRSFGIAKHTRWADLVRSEVARNALAAGFHGLYFLYKEATVTGGSILNEPRYTIPDDFIDDLAVWYDGKLLVKADPGVMNITQGLHTSTSNDSGHIPTWWNLRGRELELVPPAPEAGKEIKLFYNGLPEAISGANFSDYFLTQWPHLHVFGMAESALDYVGASALSQKMRSRFQEEVQRLMLDNRRFWIKGQRVRLMNWDEFVEKQRFVFPQFGNQAAVQEG